MTTDFEHRLTRLERSAHRWKAAAIALGLVVVGLGATLRDDHLRARSLTIVDDHDKPVVAITGDRKQPAIEGRDSEGRVRIELWILDDAVSLDVGPKGVSVGATDGQGGTVHLYHPNGKTGGIIRPE